MLQRLRRNLRRRPDVLVGQRWVGRLERPGRRPLARRLGVLLLFFGGRGRGGLLLAVRLAARYGQQRAGKRQGEPEYLICWSNRGVHSAVSVPHVLQPDPWADRCGRTGGGRKPGPVSVRAGAARSPQFYTRGPQGGPLDCITAAVGPGGRLIVGGRPKDRAAARL
jgi:hypothetical protein